MLTLILILFVINISVRQKLFLQEMSKQCVILKPKPGLISQVLGLRSWFQPFDPEFSVLALRVSGPESRSLVLVSGT